MRNLPPNHAVPPSFPLASYSSHFYYCLTYPVNNSLLKCQVYSHIYSYFYFLLTHPGSCFEPF